MENPESAHSAELERCQEMAAKLADALRFLLEPEFDYPVARRQALEVLRQYDGPES